MTTVTPKAVIFDIGNVLITWAPERLYDRVMPDRAARVAFFATVDLHGMNDRIDRGEPFRETIYATAEKYPQYRDLIRLWHDRWIDMASPRIPHSWHMLHALQETGMPVFALSNFGKESFDFALTQYPELGDFDMRFISGHMGVTKPDPEIYARVEKATGLAGPQLYFIDDRLENIEAAQARNWQGHLFTTPAHLAADLVAMGLLTASKADFPTTLVP